MDRLIVIDGNSVLNRAFYGIRELSAPDGTPTNAVYGFVTTLKRYMDRLEPSYMVCTFDTKEKTFRHKMYDKYKSNRHGMPDELAVQLPIAKEAARAMGFTLLECPGYEADDIIGTVCRAADEKGEIDSYVITGDRDSLQLISDRTKICLLRNKEDETFDRTHFTDVYTIPPELFIDLKALMGDTSDCIPGVPGIGEKTAIKLLSASGGLDRLYEDEENGFFGSTPSVRTKLAENKDLAYMSRELATICRTAPVGGDIDAYVTKGVDTDALGELFRRLAFGSLAVKFGIPKDGAAPVKKAAAGAEARPAARLTGDEVLKLTVDGDTAVALDGNTLSFYTGGRSYVVSDVSPEAAAHVMSGRPIVCHDFKKLLGDCSALGIEPECAFDVMLASYLLDPGRGTYTPENAAIRCGAPYGEGVGMAETVAKCAEELKKELEKEKMISLLHEIEIPLSAVLSKMERRGFKLDKNGLIAFSALLGNMEEKLIDAIYATAGHEFNLNSTKQLGQVLFEELGLPSFKKTKTGYSTDADTLNSLRPYHAIVGQILSYREVMKLRSTYGENLAAMADGESKIHTTFNQCGTATGRLSSSDPNLQNIPVRGGLGRELRRYFTSDGSDRVLIDADYSQIELRLLAHLSGDETMIGSFRDGLDIHATTASQVFGIPLGEVTPEMRRRAKAVNFGIVYGIGDYSLSQDLGISRKSAKEYIEGYLMTYPKVDEYLKNTVNAAVEKGYVETMFGRRRYIPELKSANKNVQAFGKRVAMNSPIQGSAADVIKIAMINVERALNDAGIDAKLIMQVHDELIVDASRACEKEAAEILRREMENAVSLSVPLVADVSTGDTWYDAK
ncbi:MAG: DNA polymerase I [Clostridia bacterium]|nr:DNA polymerase I [Clostridia bacterium]